MARRDAWRHDLRDDHVNAEAAVQRLLQLNPRSYEAFLVQARIESARGEDRKADLNYDRAAEILRKDEDALLRKFKTPAEREGLLKNVADLARKRG
jgi:hypothetical protein